MTGVRVRYVLLLTVAMLAVTAPVAVAAQTIHVVERATTDAVTNGSKQDKVGNVLTWHNKIYDARRDRAVGEDRH